MCVVALKFFEPFGACNTSLLGTGKFDLPLKSTLPTSVLAKSDEGLEGNGFTESPILEIPEYMGDTLSTSGEEPAPTVEHHDFTGGVNGGDSLVTEVPEYSGIISTLGDSPAPTVAKPEFRGGVNGSDAEIHHLSDFTGGVNGGDSLVTEVPEYSGVLSTLGDSPAPTVAKTELRGGVNGSDAEVHHISDFTSGVNGGDSLVAEVPEYRGFLFTLGDSPAPTVAKPEFRGGVNSADTEIYHLSDFTGGVNVGESPILEMPEYTGPLSTSEESVPTVEKQNITGGVNVVASPMHDNNRDSKNEATMKQVITRIASSQRIFKNEAGSVQIQASEEVLENVIGVQIQEVQVSDLSSLNYKAFDIQLKDTAARTVQPNGKVLVTFAMNQSVENVYAVDPEGKLYTIEFEQKDGKIIFEISNSSIYAMTFRFSIDNPPFKKTIEAKKNEELSLSPKLLSTNERSGFNQLDKTVGNDEQTMLPNTGETSSLLTILFGFVGTILGVMITYKRKDS